MWLKSLTWWVVVLALFGGASYYFLSPYPLMIRQFVAGIIIGLWLCLVIPLLFTPLFVPRLVNKPVGMKKSGVHFFTYIESGQVKLIVRGKVLVRMVMNTDGYKFRGVGSDDEKWLITEAIPGDQTSPLEGIHPLLLPWAWYVFKTTGAVFTGIYPFQRVREYEIERTKVKRKESKDERVIGASNLVLEVVTDVSDHFRLREFLRPMHITGAETKDKIPLDIIGVAKMMTKNPYRAAFGTDQWDQAVDNLSTNAISEKTKTLTLDEALTAITPKDARVIKEAVLGIEEDVAICGVEVTGFDVLEINPDLGPEELRIIQAEALAKQQAKATREDSAARADGIRSLNKANEEGGAMSLKTMELEAMVRATEAAGKHGGTVILTPVGSSSTESTTLTAILAELQKLNKGSK